jgi:hypothetical protein
MWLCTPFGMFMPALRPAGTIPAGDSRLLQIRSRRRIDLERLRSQYLPELGPTIQLPHTDYEYRAYCTHEQWASALARMALDIDYVKFKEQAEKQYGDHQLHHTYTAMWGTVFRKLSTKQHQQDYWGQFYPPKQKGTKNGKGKGKHTTQPALSGIDWHDVPDARPRRQSDEQPLIDSVPAEWDDEIPTVVRMPNGNIDHSFCDHAATKSARRRCRTKNR